MHRTNPSRRLWIVIACVGAMLASGMAPAAADSVDDEARFVELINNERRATGAGPLTVHPKLVEKARLHALRMVDAGEIFHSDDMADGITNWKVIGENVGKGGTIDSLHQAFMDSESHRRNILDPDFEAVGVGVVWSGNVPYVVEMFLEPATELTIQYSPPFTDDDASIHESDIVTLYEMGVTRGCDASRYCPDRNVTRAEMATMLVRAFGLTGSSGDVFGDDDSSVHEQAIETLAANGVTRGCGPDRFCPDRPVTRAEMASFLTRLLELPSASSAGFTDTGSSVHARAIDSLAAAGITYGCTDTKFCPGAYVTRGQLASFLIRALER